MDSCRTLAPLCLSIKHTTFQLAANQMQTLSQAYRELQRLWYLYVSDIIQFCSNFGGFAVIAFLSVPSKKWFSDKLVRRCAVCLILLYKYYSSKIGQRIAIQCLACLGL